MRGGTQAGGVAPGREDGDDPLGRYILIGNNPFEVIGVMSP